MLNARRISVPARITPDELQLSPQLARSRNPLTHNRKYPFALSQEKKKKNIGEVEMTPVLMFPLQVLRLLFLKTLTLQGRPSSYLPTTSASPASAQPLLRRSRNRRRRRSLRPHSITSSRVRNQDVGDFTLWSICSRSLPGFLSHCRGFTSIFAVTQEPFAEFPIFTDFQVFVGIFRDGFPLVLWEG